MARRLLLSTQSAVVAAYAARGLWETDWFEWDLTASLVPTTIKNSDFDNNGESGLGKTTGWKGCSRHWRITWHW